MISFGLVNIPIKIYSAIESNTPSFDLLHQKDMSPIRYARICKKEDKEVPYDDIVKGYEYRKSKYVVIDESDFENANVRKTNTIDILSFANLKEIDAIIFEKPYYLEPDENAEKAYALLREALIQSKKVGIGKFVLRNKEHLVSLIPSGKIIILEQLRFIREIRNPETLNLPEKEIASKREVEMALEFINKFSERFDVGKYEDTYSKDLRKIISSKIKGKDVSAKGEIPSATEVEELIDSLEKSLKLKKPVPQ